MFSVAIGSMVVERVWCSVDRVVVSKVVVVEPVVIVSRCAKVVISRGQDDDLKISDGFGFSPGK